MESNWILAIIVIAISCGIGFLLIKMVFIYDDYEKEKLQQIKKDFEANIKVIETKCPFCGSINKIIVNKYDNSNSGSSDCICGAHYSIN